MKAPSSSKLASLWTAGRFLLGKAWGSAVWLAKLAYRQGRKVALYYWSRRGEFKQYLAEYAPDLQPEKNRRREIRISKNDRFGTARFSEEGWEVHLPKCCVACGRPTDRPWLVETYRIEQFGWPVRAPLIGLALGFLLGLLFWSGWVFLLTVAAGFAAGYSFRGETEVRLHLRRCADHAFDTEFPALRSFADLLIIRVGQKSIRRQFLEERHGVYRTTVYDDLGPPPAERPRLRLVDDLDAEDAPEADIENGGKQDDERTPGEGASVLTERPSIPLANEVEENAPSIPFDEAPHYRLQQADSVPANESTQASEDDPEAPLVTRSRFKTDFGVAGSEQSDGPPAPVPGLRQASDPATPVDLRSESTFSDPPLLPQFSAARQRAAEGPITWKQILRACFDLEQAVADAVILTVSVAACTVVGVLVFLAFSYGSSLLFGAFAGEVGARRILDVCLMGNAAVVFALAYFVLQWERGYTWLAVGVFLLAALLELLWRNFVGGSAQAEAHVAAVLALFYLANAPLLILFGVAAVRFLSYLFGKYFSICRRAAQGATAVEENQGGLLDLKDAASVLVAGAVATVVAVAGLNLALHLGEWVSSGVASGQWPALETYFADWSRERVLKFALPSAVAAGVFFGLYVPMGMALMAIERSWNPLAVIRSIRVCLLDYLLSWLFFLLFTLAAVAVSWGLLLLLQRQFSVNGWTPLVLISLPVGQFAAVAFCTMLGLVIQRKQRFRSRSAS